MWILFRSPILGLVLETGETIFDSTVIVEFLDRLAGGGKIIPGEPTVRFRSLTQQALADGISDAAVLLRYEALWREPEKRSEKWTACQSDKIARALRASDAAAAEELSGIGAFGREAKFRGDAGEGVRRHHPRPLAGRRSG